MATEIHVQPSINHRLPGWEKRLAVLLHKASRTPFAWGVHDCCTLAAETVRALTGVDLSTTWRGQYATSGQALRYVTRRWGSIPRALEDLGLQPIEPVLARRGDIVAVSRWPMEPLAIMTGERPLYLQEPIGLYPGDMSKITQAWRVG